MAFSLPRWSAKDRGNGVTPTVLCVHLSLSPDVTVSVFLPPGLLASGDAERAGLLSQSPALGRPQISEQCLFLLPDVGVQLESLLPRAPWLPSFSLPLRSCPSFQQLAAEAHFHPEGAFRKAANKSRK